jgi:hypothetical protein
MDPVAEVKYRLQRDGKSKDTKDSDAAYTLFRAVLVAAGENDGMKGDSNGVKYASYCKALMDTDGGFKSAREFIMANQERARVLAAQVAEGKNNVGRVVSNHMYGFRKVAMLLEKHPDGELSMPGWE